MLEEAYNALTQDEDSKILGRMNEERTDGVSFAVQSSSGSHNFTQNRGSSIVCSLCGRTRHLAENCFRKLAIRIGGRITHVTN